MSLSRERTRSDCKSSWRKSHVQLEWRQRLESAHHQLHESVTELITNKNYSEAERRLHYVDQLMLDLMEEMGGTAVRSGLWA